MMNHKTQYVYAYLDPRKPGKWMTSVISFLYEPIYVGEGKNQRAWNHLKRKDRHHLVSKIKSLRKIGMEPIVMIVAEGLSGDEGLALETKLINEIGTRAIIDTVQRGPLTNLQIEEGSKKVISEESKAKMSIGISKALMGHKVSEETRKKISASFNRSPETKERMSAWQRGKKMTEHQKAALLKATKGIPKSEQHRKKISEANLGKDFSVAHRAAIAKSRVKGWKITFEGSSEITYSLKAWCTEHNIIEASLKSAYRYKSVYKGYFLEKLSIIT